ncbi:hypothetical protein [Haloplanus halophilus]|uniref:hypothetical protein n=1 Tax=Haloplanus halophilus TaxID=2949993 RepID=UPI00204247EC|nr:hypothetical protein [Haloplanus sp. GDY1]
MAREDLNWRPKGAVETYKGEEVWEYNIGPHERNVGEVDGDIALEDIVEPVEQDSVIKDVD